MFPLYMTRPNERVRIIHIDTDHALRKKLIDIGIAPEVCVRVISVDQKDPTVVEKDGMRLMLSYSVSKKIYVLPHNGGE